ncbi:hypothetical protein [Hydrogenophaga flava]|uniref:hypothetical protein n=1 Tax=Hydrogenophaga flava TaxID=65657 RepID=UPI000B071FC4|nr:hypothetical protein [Hydrogenophaga flava]
MKNRLLSACMMAGVFSVNALLGTAPAHAQEADPVQSAARACMRAWGSQHPFTDTPPLRTVSGAVRVLGRGSSVADREVTDFPVLVVVEPGVNVLGESEMELLNPNGWYCLRAAVNVGGGLRIKLHCDAHISSATSGTSVFGDNAGRGVSVMGAISVERVGCAR